MLFYRDKPVTPFGCDHSIALKWQTTSVFMLFYRDKPVNPFGCDHSIALKGQKAPTGRKNTARVRVG